jgi:hypothetical protein
VTIVKFGDPEWEMIGLENGVSPMAGAAYGCAGRDCC